MSAPGEGRVQSGRTHELKCEQPWFQALWSGHKTFEVRKNDRDFQPGDWLEIRECWINDDGQVNYTGRMERREVSYVLRDGERFGIAEGYVVLGLYAWDAPSMRPKRSSHA